MQGSTEYVGALPVDAGTLLSNHRGIREASLVRRRTRLAARLGSLKRYLEDGERVLMISVLRPHERIRRALLLRPPAHAVVVFTDRRLLHVGLPRRSLRRGAISTIRYRERRRAHLRGGRLTIWLAGGGRERLEGIPVADRRKVRHLLEQLPPPRRTAERAGKRYLCPRCTAALTPARYLCHECGQEFLDPGACARSALLTPGGGYFRLGCGRWGVRCAGADAGVTLITLLGAASMTHAWPVVAAGLTATATLRLLAARHARRLARQYVPVGATRPWPRRPPA